MDRKLLLNAQPWFEVWREQVRLPDGRIIPDYYKLVVRDAAAVVTVTAHGEILVLRQYKHGLGETVWGLPAGFCNDNESALACAQRELFEETGFRAEQWIGLGNYVRDANRGGASVHIFLALNAQQVAEPSNHDLEECQVHCLKMADLLRLIRNQQVKPLGAIAAILLAHLYLDPEGHKLETDSSP